MWLADDENRGRNTTATTTSHDSDGQQQTDNCGWMMADGQRRQWTTVEESRLMSPTLLKK
jgi:hypothetical protein